MTNQNNQPVANAVSFLQCLKGTWIDKLVLLALIITVAFLWRAIHQNLTHGTPTAYIYHGKQLLAFYPIPAGEKTIHVAAQGEIGISDIEISSTGVRFVSSPCSSHHCMLAGHKRYAGSVIACVPNHIMTVIRGSIEKTNKFDAITE